MILLGLNIKNIRKIQVLELIFSANGLIPIKGGNRQGKTTIIDAAEALFIGRSITKDMVSHGKKKGVVEGVLKRGDDVYNVVRTISNKGKNALKITKNDESVILSPQTFLDKLINDLTFNPRPFMNKSDHLKMTFLMKLLKIDFAEIDKTLKDERDKRLLIGRDIKKIGKLAFMESCERVSVTKLISDKNIISKANGVATKTYTDKVTVEQKKQTAIDVVNARIEQVEYQITQLQDELVDLRSRTADLPAAKTVDQPLLRNTDDLDIAIANASEANEQADKYERYLRKRDDLESLEATQSKHSSTIKKLENDKKETLAATKMPIPGLEIVLDDPDRPTGLYFNKIHSDEWSDSEAMTISMSLCIAMKPELQCLFIDKGESFDRESQDALNTWCETNDIRMIMTIVDDVPDVIPEGEIWMEEGEMLK